MGQSVWRICAAFAVVLASGTAQADERIVTFLDTVDVAPDGAVAVREKVAFQVTGEQIIHGIYRDLPTGHYDPDDHWVDVNLDVTRVTRDGKREPFTIEPGQIRTLQIKIGNPDVVLDPGMHDYEIAYRVDKWVFVGNGIGAVRWNATGNGWKFAIDQVLAKVTLPEGTHITSTDAYSRGADRAGNNAVAGQPEGHVAKFRSIAPLMPSDGMSVLVCFGFDGPASQWTAAVQGSDSLIEKWCALRTANAHPGMQRS